MSIISWPGKLAVKSEHAVSRYMNRNVVKAALHDIERAARMNQPQMAVSIAKALAHHAYEQGRLEA